jgi:hypothetical protein
MTFVDGNPGRDLGHAQNEAELQWLIDHIPPLIIDSLKQNLI